MRVLVLQRPKSVEPMESWLCDAADNIEVRLVTGADTLRPNSSIRPGVSREILDAYDSPRATRAIFEICASWQPDAIFSNAERDVMRAAEARTLFGLPGMTASSAVYFRDKVLMKQLFAGLSIRAVDYCVPSCAADVLAACEEFGRVVLKPRDECSSIGVRVLAGVDAAQAVLIDDPELLLSIHRRRMLVERFIDGDVYHVDVALRDQKPLLISTSRYLAPPYLSQSRNLGSAMVDPSSQDRATLVGYAEEFAAAIAPDHHPRLIHLELFKNNAGEFLAGEVACRGGAGSLMDCIEHTYGVRPVRLACLLEAGLPVDIEACPAPGRLSGWILESAAPFDTDFDERPDWLVELKVRRSTNPARPIRSGRAIVADGDSHAEVVNRLMSLNRRSR